MRDGDGRLDPTWSDEVNRCKLCHTSIWQFILQNNRMKSSDNNFRVSGGLNEASPKWVSTASRMERCFIFYRDENGCRETSVREGLLREKWCNSWKIDEEQRAASLTWVCSKFNLLKWFRFCRSISEETSSVFRINICIYTDYSQSLRTTHSFCRLYSWEEA